MGRDKKTDAGLVFPWFLPGIILGVIIGAIIAPQEPGFHFWPYAFAMVPIIGLNRLIMYVYYRRKRNREDAG
ncbi:hypothetical protein NBM05_08540 [Rothia sp. AR01]|uniref:Uncharacterized protein n=1 Tax=Rothia santali TaxID=2949643 RepID=A0A9X2HF02_9MICC|nr:hypothetical protein [Rothia santali]MCP3426049.1 hypothetical protein [Rothia santali]